MNNSKVKKAGYMFGVICRNIGATFSLILTALIPNSESVDKFINTEYIIPDIIAILVFVYGIWRTGGVDYD